MCVYLLKAGQLGECLLGSLPVALLLLNQYLAATQHAMVASHRTHNPPRLVCQSFTSLSPSSLSLSHISSLQSYRLTTAPSPLPLRLKH